MYGKFEYITQQQQQQKNEKENIQIQILIYMTMEISHQEKFKLFLADMGFGVRMLLTKN